MLKPPSMVINDDAAHSVVRRSNISVMEMGVWFRWETNNIVVGFGEMLLNERC